MTIPLTTFIVAGGRSSRMGRDKADIEISGRTMLAHACALATAVGSDRVLVLGRPGHALGVPDEKPFEGPARAVATQLARLEKPARILVLPVDMPFLKAPVIKALLDSQTGGYFDDMYLPFAARVHEDILFDGERIRDLLAALGVASLPSDPAWRDALVNINTPDALARVTAR